MLEEALLMAQLTQKGTPDELNEILNMISHAPAKAMGLRGYGLESGNPAHLVLVEGEDPKQALEGQVMRTHVISRGSLVYTSRKVESFHF